MREPQDGSVGSVLTIRERLELVMVPSFGKNVCGTKTSTYRADYPPLSSLEVRSVACHAVYPARAHMLCDEYAYRDPI